jgi:hypothetical protein
VLSVVLRIGQLSMSCELNLALSPGIAHLSPPEIYCKCEQCEAVSFSFRICLMSHRPEFLLPATETLCHLIFPFHWEHIFIPLLPEKLIDFICAPMPFICGEYPLANSVETRFVLVSHPSGLNRLFLTPTKRAPVWSKVFDQNTTIEQCWSISRSGDFRDNNALTGCWHERREQ